MQSPVCTHSLNSPRSVLKTFHPPNPHQYLYFPFLWCFLPFLSAHSSQGPGVWEGTRHSCLPLLQGQGKAEIWHMGLFPETLFQFQWDMHWDTQAVGMKWVEKTRSVTKAGRSFLQTFPRDLFFLLKLYVSFKDHKPPLIAAPARRVHTVQYPLHLERTQQHMQAVNVPHWKTCLASQIGFLPGHQISGVKAVSLVSLTEPKSLKKKTYQWNWR